MGNKLPVKDGISVPRRGKASNNPRPLSNRGLRFAQIGLAQASTKVSDYPKKIRQQLSATPAL
jgi:hypothetical protein